MFSVLNKLFQHSNNRQLTLREVIRNEADLCLKQNGILDYVWTEEWVPSIIQDYLQSSGQLRNFTKDDWEVLHEQGWRRSEVAALCYNTFVLFVKPQLSKTLIVCSVKNVFDTQSLTSMLDSMYSQATIVKPYAVEDYMLKQLSESDLGLDYLYGD